MAPYGRNLEASQDFEVDLVAGANEISIWFDDLAERDARYYFQLDYLPGPLPNSALPTTVKGESRRPWKPRWTRCISSVQLITTAKSRW